MYLFSLGCIFIWMVTLTGLICCFLACHFESILFQPLPGAINPQCISWTHFRRNQRTTILEWQIWTVCYTLYIYMYTYMYRYRYIHILFFKEPWDMFFYFMQRFNNHYKTNSEKQGRNPWTDDPDVDFQLNGSKLLMSKKIRSLALDRGFLSPPLAAGAATLPRNDPHHRPEQYLPPLEKISKWCASFDCTSSVQQLDICASLGYSDTIYTVNTLFLLTFLARDILYHGNAPDILAIMYKIIFECYSFRPRFDCRTAGGGGGGGQQ